jgi:hypothetical protein
MDELVTFVIVIVVIIAVIKLLVLAVGAIAAAILAFIYWGPLCVAILSARYAFASFLSQQNSPSSARLFRASIDSDYRLRCSVSADGTSQQIEYGTIVAGVVAVAGCLLAWVLIDHLGILQDSYHAWRNITGSGNRNTPVMISKGAVLVAAIAAVFLSQLFHKRWIQRFGEDLVNHFNQRAVQFDEIKALEERIGAYAQKLRINLTYLPQQELKAALEKHLQSLLWSPQEFQIESDRITELARQEQETLRQCFNDYNAAVTLCREVTRLVTTLDRRSLIDDMDGLTEALEDKGLRIRLEQREWSVFREGIAFLVERLNQLKAFCLDDEMRQEEERREEDERHASDARNKNEQSSNIRDRDQACEILNVPADATMTQIEKMYQKLAQMWHSDRAGRDEKKRMIYEEKMTRINQARDYLYENPQH